jgi:hypothetical protein
MRALRAVSSGLVVAALVALSVTAALPAGHVSAAPVAADPLDIVLTLDDLPSGFAPDPRYTVASNVPNAGPSQEVQYQREATMANLTDGPIVVGQIVIRLDGPLGAGDALTGVKQTLIEKNGLVPSDEGPNDGGTFTLARVDNNLKLMAVGFIKGNWIIVTMTGGLPQVVTSDINLRLAGISSAKIDAIGG